MINAPARRGCGGRRPALRLFESLLETVMRTTHAAITLSTLACALASAQAATFDVPLAASGWLRDYIPAWQTSHATLVNTAEGHLRGTITNSAPGTNWFLGVETALHYDLQDATLRYKWLLNGQGSYAGTYSGLYGLAYNVDPNPPYFGGLTTAWSYAGSEVIPSNTWLYTELKFSPTGYDFAVSKLGYGQTDFLHGTKNVGTPTWWAALATAHPFIQIGDNYQVGAYFELAEMSITSAPVVPEPQAYALLLAGLGVLGLVAKRR